MRKGKKSKSGFTIAELCIVFALIAIVCVMVVFFSTYISKRVKLNNQHIALLRDVKSTETFVESWVADMRENGATFSIGGKSKISATANGETHELVLIDGKLVADFFGQIEEKTLNLESFDSFTVTKEEKGEKVIFFVTMTASIEYDNAIKVYPHTFTVYPLVGFTGTIQEGGTP